MEDIKENLEDKNKTEKRIIIEKVIIASISAIALFIIFLGFAKILNFWSDGFNYILPSLTVLLSLIGVLNLVRKKYIFAIIYWVAALIILGFFIGVEIYKLTYWN
jgi:hypothetical protein